MRLRQIIEHTVFSEMPLHSYHLNIPNLDPSRPRAIDDFDRMSSPVKNSNYEKSLIKFMKRFPGPDWIVIVGLLEDPWELSQSKTSIDNNIVKKYLLDKGISEQIINSSIVFAHDGGRNSSLAGAESVTPWILTHNFAHAIGLDGKSHVIYPLLGYEELSPNQKELNDPEGKFKKNSSDDPNDVWFPGDERFNIPVNIKGVQWYSPRRDGYDPKEVVKKVQQDLKFKSAGGVSLDVDELCCEMFTEFMKHGGKIRSKNNIDYSKVEQYFYKILESRVGKITIYGVVDQEERI